MLRLAKRIDDPKARDYCFRAYIGGSHERDPKELITLIDEIEAPSIKAAAWFSMARAERADFEQATTYLNEARRLGNIIEAAGGVYSLGMVSSRFAKDQPDAVADYFQSALLPQDAVIAIGHAGVYCDFQHKSPKSAARLLQRGAELVPSCPDQAAATVSLLHSGLAKHHPTLALELFDKFVEPAVKETPDYPISYLWPAGLQETMKRAERYCINRGIPSERVKARVIGRIASFDNPELVVQWLETATPSSLRDESTVEIIRGVEYHAVKTRGNREQLVKWIDRLTKYALSVDDKPRRAEACLRIASLVAASREQPPIPLPVSVREEYVKLWPEIEAKLDSEARENHIQRNLALLPTSIQVDTIRQALAKKRVRQAAALVWGSSLSQEDKASWHRQVLSEARTIADLPKRSAALSGIAQCFRQDNPDQCLRLLWESLRISQKLGLKPEYHDVSDGLGTVFPLATADECIRLGFKKLPADDKTVSALWSFARELDRREEQEVLLERTVEMLLRQGDTDKAAGVVQLIDDPARRARAWGAVAVVIRGKPLRNDW